MRLDMKYHMKTWRSLYPNTCAMNKVYSLKLFKDPTMYKSIRSLLRAVGCGMCMGLVLGESAIAASFDCVKAQTHVEKMICADAELSKLDREMAATFAEARKTKNKGEVVKQEQMQWLKARNDCNDVGCLKTEYRNRISNLAEDAKADIPMGPRMRMTAWPLKQPNLGADAGWDFVLHPGAGVEDWLEDGDDPMCQKVKDYMNKVARKWEIKQGSPPKNSCSAAVGLAPFLSEPPWIELDPQKHEDLIIRLLWSSQDPDSYFKTSPPRPGYEESYFRKQAREFVEKGGRLQHWRVRLVEVFYFPPGNDVPAPPGEQDVIQLRYRNDTSSAARKTVECNLPDWEGQVFLVTPDLGGPIRNLENMGSLYLYEGDPVLVSSFSEVSVKSPHHNRASHSCRLTYPNHTAADTQKGN